MHIVRFKDAPRYDAPGHSGMSMRRLQGKDAGPTDTVWLGMSVVAPHGGTTLSASNVEKFYVVLEGELEMTSVQPDGTRSTATLGPKDSCRIAPHECRQLINRREMPATVLLVMPNT
jgi:hypothetical protein